MGPNTDPHKVFGRLGTGDVYLDLLDISKMSAQIGWFFG